MYKSCRQCPHFYLTGQKGLPYGCNFFGFLSHSYPPELILYQSSGKRCDLLMANQTQSKKTDPANDKSWLA